MVATDDTRTAVERLVTAKPRLTTTEIARTVKVSRQRVHQLLMDMGFRQEWVRRGP